MIRPLPLLVVLSCGACTERQVDSGTAVGNPGNLTFGSDLPDDGGIDVAEARIAELYLHPCDGEATRLTELEFDLLMPGQQALEVAADVYCGLDVLYDTDQPVLVEGTTPEGTAFTAVLPLPDLAFDQDAFVVDGSDLLVELPIAAHLPSDAIDGKGPDASLPRDDADSEIWAGAVDGGSRLLLDGREVSTYSGSPAATSGCGCTTGSSTGWLWWPLALSVVALRRRYQGS